MNIEASTIKKHSSVEKQNILEKIVANKRIEIEALKSQKPLSSFINTLAPSKKDMYAALKRTDRKSVV